MSNRDTWKILTDVFRLMFDDQDLAIGPETTAQDIEDWDSLTHVQLMVAVEDAFDVRFNTGELVGLKNVGQMVTLIESRI